MKKINTAIAVIAALFSAALIHAAGPVMELYPSHVTFLLDYDTGSHLPTVGDIQNAAIASACTFGQTSGLFGTTALDAGSVNYNLKDDHTVIDMTKPGTVIFWTKLKSALDTSSGTEPGGTPFCAQWSTTPNKRWFVFRQSSLAWGQGRLATRFETKDSNNANYIIQDYYSASLKNWVPGEWHLCATTHTPTGFGISLDGQPFKNIVSAEPLGPLSKYINFQASANCAMDDCAVLDFKMSDDQVKQLYDEYKAQLQESPRTASDPTFGTLQTVADGSSAYLISLAVTNNTAQSVTIVWKATATPQSSQPATTQTSVTLAAGASQVLQLTGPALDQETVTADVTVETSDGTRKLFHRHRVFAPHSDEPEWMRDLPPVGLSFAYYPTTNTVHALVDLTGNANAADVTSIRCSVLDETGHTTIASANFSPDPSGRTEIFWRTIPELNGNYIFRAEAVGITDAYVDQPFVRVRPVWEGNQHGLSGTIPAPFTAVEREGNHVRTVLRDHEIGNFGLWSQVTAAGKNVLARPIALKSGGQTITTSTKMSATSEWDVDGMMVWKLTLQPGSHNAMYLEIPLLGERAPLMHACADGLRMNYAGAVPAGTGSVWNSSQAQHNYIVGDYVPYVWVGGPLRGISVFGENDKGWITANNVHHQEIVRENDGTVVIKLNLVAAATNISEARTIKIGFMATPVKPMLDNWRSVDHGRLMGGNMYYGGAYASLAGFDNTDGFLQVMGEERRTGVYNSAYLNTAVANFPYGSAQGTPEWQTQYNSIYAHYRSGLVTAYTEGHKPETKLVFYTNARGAYYGDAWGQGATFCNEWCRQEYMGREFRIDSCAYTDNDPTKSFRDYAAYWYERMLSTGAGDFIYWDNVFCQSSYNQVLTDAYRLPTGAVQPSSGIFNMRELVKRAAVLQAELGKNTRGNWVHMTNTALAPVLAFAGVNYDWEDTADSRTFQQRYSREYIQACATGRQFGNRVSIIGYFDKSNATTFNWLVHTGVGVMLTHELRWIDTDHAEYKNVHARLCDWGYRTSDVNVWNYWDEDVAYPLQVTGLTCASIAMAKPSANEAYICVSSFENASGTVTIQPNLAAMGINANEWTATLMTLSGTSLVASQSLPVTNGRISVALPRYDWALIKISTTGAQPEEPQELTGYDELIEFIETDGAQWIDTGIKPNPKTTRVKARFIPLECLASSSSSDNIVLFGVNGTANNATDSKNFNAILGYGNSGYQIRPLWTGATGSSSHYPTSGSYQSGQPFEIAFDLSGSNPKASINKYFTSEGPSAKFDGTLDHSIYLGNINNAGSGLYTDSAAKWRMGNVRWLSFQAWDGNGNLIADLRPALNGGIAGFHDSVTDKFFQSKGTRGFIAPSYQTWNDGTIPGQGFTAVIGTGEVRRVSYEDVTALNKLAGIRMLHDSSQLIFTNGNVSSVTFYTPIYGKGKVINQNSNASSSCLLNFSGDSTGFTGEFLISNAYTAGNFAPYAFGTTNKVTINNGDSSDKRRFLLNNMVCDNEFHFVKAANYFIGYGNPTVTGPVYLDGAVELSFHGNGSGITFTGPFYCSVPNDTSKLNLSSTVTFTGGPESVKYFGKKQLRGAAGPVTLGCPMRFEEKAYSSTLMNNCNFSCNKGASTVFTMANVFDEKVFFVCNYDAANGENVTTTINLNGFDQQVGTFGVSSKSGFNTSTHYNANLSITSADPAIFTIRKTCRNDNAANCYYGSIKGKASLCMNSSDATPGKISLNCPGSTTTGSLIARRGTIEILPTATLPNLESISAVENGKITVDTASVGNSNSDFSVIFGGTAGLEIASGVTLVANTAQANGRWLQPGLYGKNATACAGLSGDGQLRVMTYGGTGPEITEPTAGNVPTISGADGVYTITTADSSIRTVGVSGLGEDDRLIVPSNIDKVKGVSSVSQIQAGMTPGGVNIISGCTITVANNEATIVLDGTKSVQVGGEQIPVAPELADTDASGDPIEPMVAAEGTVTLNVKTIPGLKYQLIKTSSLADAPVEWHTVGSPVVAESTRTSLADDAATGPAVFYKTEASK